VPQLLGQHLDPDEDQDEGQAEREVLEAVAGALEQREQRAQAEQGEGVGGEDDERVRRDAEDGGDRVDGEDDVGRGHGGDHGQQRRGHPLAVLLDEVGRAAEVLRDRDDLLERPDADVLLRVDVLLLPAVAGHLDARVEQDRAEDVEDPGEGLHERRARDDEDRAQDEREDDAELQDVLALGDRHRHRTEDEREDEHVVQRQRALEQVARQVLRAGLRRLEQEQADAEEDRHGDPDHRPHRRALERRRRVVIALEEEEVDDEREHDERDQATPGHNAGVHEI
jgi:hypothetical protein